MAQWLRNLTRNHEDAGSLLASFSGLGIWHCRELWCRPSATAPIRPLAWEPPCAMGAALTKDKKKKKSETQDLRPLHINDGFFLYLFIFTF